MRKMIISALKKYKHYVSSEKMLKQYLDRYPDPGKCVRHETLVAKRTIIECWLGLLSEDELYVIQRHLIDGISWSRLHEEHVFLRGEDFAKTERMLKINQAAALSKMVAFSEEYRPLAEELFTGIEVDVDDAELMDDTE